MGHWNSVLFWDHKQKFESPEKELRRFLELLMFEFPSQLDFFVGIYIAYVEPLLWQDSSCPAPRIESEYNMADTSDTKLPPGSARAGRQRAGEVSPGSDDPALTTGSHKYPDPRHIYGYEIYISILNFWILMRYRISDGYAKMSREEYPNCSHHLGQR